MDLLNQNQNTQKVKGKGLLKALLVISIIGVIVILIAMVYLGSNKVPEDVLYVNGEKKEMLVDLFITDTQQNKYISLKDLSELLGYEYYNSEYNSYSVDSTKCYVKNKNLISGFELGSAEIYKYEETTNLDFQRYTLTYNVLIYNNKLYIAVADLEKALNANCVISENNEIRINSMEYLATTYQEQLKEKGYTVTTEPNNQKALAYGWIIANKSGLWCVLNTELQEIIDPKYTNIYFDEQNLNYIVSNSNKQYGVISTSGNIEHSLKYDEVQVLNYENELYKVKYNEKYGIMKFDGSMLTEIVYDEIGYKAETDKKILYTLIIPEVYGKTGSTIVIKQDKFYGLVKLEDGSLILPCDHAEKIYAISELGETQYRVEAEKQTVSLLDYLEYRNQLSATLN